MDNSDIDQHFLERRIEQICEGLKEGIRREVERLRELGLPIYVADQGRVVDRQADPQTHRESS